MAELIFNVVTEDIKRPHVAQDVPDPPMKEHEGYERKHLLETRKIGADLGYGIPGRDKTVDVDKFIQLRPQGQLIEENDNIDADYGVIDNRIIFRRDGVTQGNHFTRFIC